MVLKELFQKVASLGFCVFSVQYDPTTQIFELDIQTPLTEQKCRVTMMALEAAKFDISSMVTDALFVDVIKHEENRS